jgi:hypothetical protein
MPAHADRPHGTPLPAHHNTHTEPLTLLWGCADHGYVLAEMSVHQTRAHFLSAGGIVDNPEVAAGCWFDCLPLPGGCL